MISADINSKQTKPTLHRLGPWEIKGVDFILFLSISFISIYLLSSIALNLYSGESEILPSILSGYGLQLGAIVGYVVFSRLQNAPQTSNPCSPIQAIIMGFWAMLFSYACLLLISPVWRLLLEALNIPYVLQDPVQMLIEGGTRLEMGLMYFLIVVGAPVGEELLFRAGVFRFLSGKMPAAAAIVISSVIFASVHFNAYSFGPLVVLGAIMCLVYRKTGNILSSITLHALFNFTNLIFISYFPQVSQ